MIDIEKLITELNNIDDNACSLSLHPYTDFYGNSKTELLIEVRVSDTSYYSLPDSKEAFTSFKNGVFLMISDPHIIKIRIPLYLGELKRFYDNYQDYYYLPAEDTCIYKSIGAALDKSKRQNAKKETCYTKHNGLFLVSLSNSANAFYKNNYSAKQSYYLYEDKLFTEEFIKSYLKDIIKYLLI